MDSDHRKSIDWEMFWIIEKKDMPALKSLCHEMRAKNKDIGMYFKMAYWQDIFTPSEARTITVYMCGSMDFSPIQHAVDIGWIHGAKCLLDNGIGYNGQGCGLPVIDSEKLIEYCRLNDIQT